MKPQKLELIHIIKDYPGVRALNGVSLRIESGEILSICGENGAGKSTLMKVMSGVISHGQFAGQIKVNQKDVCFTSLKESEKNGIAIIHQELSIIEDLTLAENIFLGHEKSRWGLIDKKIMSSRTRDLLAQVGLDFNPQTSTSELSIGQRQLLEIAKALSLQPRFLIMDEPTSALAGAEVERLLDVIRSLKKQGVACIIISHKLDEVFQISDRILVLRDGASVFELAVTQEIRTNQKLKDNAIQEVIRAMVGREIKEIYPSRSSAPVQSESVLEVKNLTNSWIEDVSFSVKRGQILGIAGLMGSGRSELLMTLFGAGPKITSGEVLLLGQKFSPRSPAHSARRGIALVTEDRKNTGLMLEHAITDNAALTPLGLGRFSRAGVIQFKKRFEKTSLMLQRLRLKSSSLAAPAQNLSGGNQQKVVLAKWLLSDPKILFLDEPTRGIDVGARAEFYDLIRELSKSGLGVVVVSSELSEVMGLSDYLLVMREGRVVYQALSSETQPDTVIAYATGAKQ